jgi:hypothetical protein
MTMEDWSVLMGILNKVPKSDLTAEEQKIGLKVAMLTLQRVITELDQEL